MRYICKDIITANGNPISDGASQKLFATYGALELNGIARIVLRVNSDFNVLMLLDGKSQISITKYQTNSN